MLKTWVVLYKGTVAVRKLTQRGAEAAAYEAIKAKGWSALDVEVKQEAKS